MHPLMYVGGKRASLGCEVELRHVKDEAFDDRHGAYILEFQCILLNARIQASLALPQ